MLSLSHSLQLFPHTRYSNFQLRSGGVEKHQVLFFVWFLVLFCFVLFVMDWNQGNLLKQRPWGWQPRERRGPSWGEGRCGCWARHHPGQW